MGWGAWGPPIQQMQAVPLIQVDPELASGIPAEEMPLLRRRSVVRLEGVERGPWAVPPLERPGAFGFLVVDGLVGARVRTGNEAYLEILGPGDLLRPWVPPDPDASVSSDVEWRVLDRTTVAVLDDEFARRVAPWPPVAASLMHRLVIRARRLGFQLALAGISRVDERLLTALWHFADRWGRVTPDGVAIRLALTQTELGEVIRATRPSVSTAVGQLRRAGRLSFDRACSQWTLHERPAARVERAVSEFRQS